MLHCLCILLGALQEPVEEPAAPKPEVPSWVRSLHGRLDLRYRNRWTTRQSDADLIQLLTLDYGDPSKDAVSGSLTARFAEDLDGERDVSGFYAFDSIDDTYRHGSTGRLYTAYVDVNAWAPTLKIRAGRQVLESIPEAFPFDGGHVQVTAADGVRVGLFGGVPVNLFESSPSEDATYGGWAEADPWRGGRARLEYLHLEDENAFGVFDDDLVGATFDQRLGIFRLRGRHTRLESEARESSVRVHALVPGVAAYAGLTYLHERQIAVSYPVDPYSAFLLDVEPYWQGLLGGAVELGGGVGVDGSFTARELATDGDEKAYNREYRRFNITPRVTGWPHADLSFGVPLDYWQSSQDDFWTGGLDVLIRAHPRVDLVLVSSYALFVVDAFTGEERERARTHSARLRWRVETGIRLDLRITREKNDLDTYRTFEVGASHVF